MENLDYEAEMEIIARTAKEDNSILTSAVVSVIRDRAVAGCYGKCAELFVNNVNSLEVPYDFIFSKKVSDYVSESLARFGVKNPKTFYPLYGGEADLIGQLSRLLIAVRENSPMYSSTQLAKVNQRLADLGFKAWFRKDDDYVRHLRNAIVHNRFKVVNGVDGDPSNTELVFLDVHNNAITAKLQMNWDDLDNSINIILEGITSYLEESGWEIST